MKRKHGMLASTLQFHARRGSFPMFSGFKVTGCFDGACGEERHSATRVAVAVPVPVAVAVLQQLRLTAPYMRRGSCVRRLLAAWAHEAPLKAAERASASTRCNVARPTHGSTCPSAQWTPSCDRRPLSCCRHPLFLRPNVPQDVLLPDGCMAVLHARPLPFLCNHPPFLGADILIPTMHSNPSHINHAATHSGCPLSNVTFSSKVGGWGWGWKGRGPGQQGMQGRLESRRGLGSHFQGGSSRQEGICCAAAAKPPSLTVLLYSLAPCSGPSRSGAAAPPGPPCTTWCPKAHSAACTACSLLLRAVAGGGGRGTEYTCRRRSLGHLLVCATSNMHLPCCPLCHPFACLQRCGSSTTASGWWPCRSATRSTWTQGSPPLCSAVRPFQSLFPFDFSA